MTKTELAELVRLRQSATDAAAQFTDALDAIAQKRGRNKRALRRYVAAIASDKVRDLRDELAGLEQLDMDFGSRRESEAA